MRRGVMNSKFGLRCTPATANAILADLRASCIEAGYDDIAARFKSPAGFIDWLIEVLDGADDVKNRHNRALRRTLTKTRAMIPDHGVYQ